MPADNIINFPGVPHPGVAFRLRAELVLMPEPVWREIIVPANYTFWDLHVALQDAFGWLDCHLHQFNLDSISGGEPIRMGIPDSSGFHGSREILVGWDHLIGDFLSPDLPPMLYAYDFGDGWQHEVELVQIMRNQDLSALPVCTDGAGRCPEEDCGGPPGWAERFPALNGLPPFEPESVIFDDPRERWRRSFGND
jgi:hypothetical protein